MEKEFVTYEQALALKELGFDEPCFGYHKHTTIPNKIISNDLIIGFIKDNRIYNDVSNGGSLVGLGKGLVFREKYNLDASASLDTFSSRKKSTYRITGGIEAITNSYNDLYDIDSEEFDTFEEAESACLDELIGIVKKNS